MKTFQKGMEITNDEIREGEEAPSTADQESAALDIIRTETVLSRLPIHNLAKKGNVNIQILKTTPDGKVELKWIVSYSDRYGQARQLAYKLDTIVINHHIDEQRRPLPKMICLGSLRDVADQLDLGGDTNKVRRALRQNASAFITAKFEYRGSDGSKKTLEADFTRYSVVFTGEQLPDGRRADAVYIILNEPYREVLNNAPVRPLDRAYMKTLPPAAQRFYEIISYKIFSAIKNDYPHAKITYSEYCTFSAQLRHFERQPIQDQMAKIIRHHKESGYITAVQYQATIDTENKPDWIMYLAPGPRARAEFTAAHTRRKILKHGDGSVGASREDAPKLRKVERPVEPQVAPSQSQPRFDPLLISELTRRGINERMALELLANLKPGQERNLLAQLEYAEQTVHQLNSASQQIRNPAGFIISMIQSNATLPENFETSAQRKTRQERERKEGERRVAEEARQVLRDEYDRYCSAETDRYIGEHPDIFAALKETKLKEEHQWSRGLSFTPSETIATTSAKWQIREQVPFLTFEEFLERKKQGTDFFLKPVGPSPPPEAATNTHEPEDMLAADEAREAAIQKPVMAAEETIDAPVYQPETEPTAVNPEPKSPAVEVAPPIAPLDAVHADTPESATIESHPAVNVSPIPTQIPESPAVHQEPLMIELVSDPPVNDFGGAAAEHEMA